MASLTDRQAEWLANKFGWSREMLDRHDVTAEGRSLLLGNRFRLWPRTGAFQSLGKSRRLWPSPSVFGEVHGDDDGLGGYLMLVDSPMHALAGLSAGFSCVALPGWWSSSWAKQLTAFHKLVLLPSASKESRALMRRVEFDVEHRACRVMLVDLWPHREDGFGLHEMFLWQRSFEVSSQGRRWLHGLVPLRRVG